VVRCVIKGLGVLILAALVVLGAALLTAPRWLPSVARVLRVEDPLRRADLIVVLSGSVPDRPRYAADLYRAGFAPRVLCASSLTSDLLEAIGHPMTQAQLSATVLRTYGVPDKNILVFNRSTSTYQELALVRDTMRSHGWRRVILVSSPTHLRRVRMTWDRLTRGGGPEAILRATPYSKFHANAWWRHERDLIAVQNEYAKVGYYLLFTFRGVSPVDAQ
jgi:uncharacterized SAM-binding protein YcdF (DUF218 family)